MMSRHYIGIIAFVLSTAVPMAAVADDANTAEQSLLDSFANGQLKAEQQKVALSEVASEAIPDISTVEGASNSTDTDRLIEELIDEVEGLKNKVVVTRAAALATTQPRRAPQIGARTVYTYQDGSVYEVRAGIDQITDVALQPGERLTSAPMAGDTVRWKIGIIESGQGGTQQQHLIVKPLDTALDTNLIVTTDRRVYHLRLLSSDWAQASISWRYPDDEERENQAKILQAQREEAVRTRPEDLYFDYEVSKTNCSWCPLRVFDDGSKTYIQMPKEMATAEAPVLFLLEDGEPLLINYRVKGDYFVIDRIFSEAELRVGTNKRVLIESKRGRRSFFERIFS